MATYTNRTCNTCGIRKPQPEMYHVETYSEVAKSVQGVSAATFIGSILFNNGSSDRTIANWLFNNNQRTYKRKKKVWLCAKCSGNLVAPSLTKRFFKALLYFFLFSIVIAAILGQLTN
jgi:hypothetical protein